jgi:hypothetical protein
MTVPCPVHTFAQDRLSLPRIGVALGADSTLRDIQGVPGAARFVLRSDRTPWTWLYSASHAPSALAVTTTTASLVGTDIRVSIEASFRAAAISPKGRYFALAAGDTVTTFDATGATRKSLDLRPTGFEHSDTLALAVSDDGSIFVAGPSMIAFRSANLSRVVAVPFPVLFPRFAPASNLLAAYDARNNAVVLIHADTLASETILTPARDGLSIPTGLEFADAHTLWISQTGANSLIRYSLDARSAQSFAREQPGALRPTGTAGVYLWNDATLLDTLGVSPQLLIIATPEAQ